MIKCASSKPEHSAATTIQKLETCIVYYFMEKGSEEVGTGFLQPISNTAMEHTS